MPAVFFEFKGQGRASTGLHTLASSDWSKFACRAFFAEEKEEALRFLYMVMRAVLRKGIIWHIASKAECVMQVWPDLDILNAFNLLEHPLVKTEFLLCKIIYTHTQIVTEYAKALKNS